MKNNTREIERRRELALAAIRGVLGKKEGEFSVGLFVSHHLQELDPAYWKKHAGEERPSPEAVLDLLVLRSHWSADDKDGIDAFDFTLPADATDYAICVRFDEKGDVEDIAMES